MTVRWTVRAALTEERSKAEIKNSALRCRDETKSFKKGIAKGTYS